MLPYIPQVTEVLDLVLRMKAKEAYLIGTRILERTLTYMTTLYIVPECVKNRTKWDADFKKYLPIRVSFCGGRGFGEGGGVLAGGSLAGLFCGFRLFEFFAT